MKRVPLVPLQKGVYQTLSKHQTTPVYDDVPENARLPYITLGAFTCRENGSKCVDITDCSLQIHIWSEYRGQKQVNEIANDIVNVVGAVKIDVTEANFYTIQQEVSMVEGFDEDEYGYHGVITIDFKIQNLEES